MEILFQKIPGFLFEPLAVTAVIAIVFVLIEQWHKRNALYWSIAFAVFFMVAWRIGMKSISGRYAAILVYPALILIAYFCFRLEMFAAYLPAARRHYWKAVPYLLLTGLSLACVGKILNFNRYDDYIRYSCRQLKQDADDTSNHAFYIFGKFDQLDRYLYYIDGKEKDIRIREIFPSRKALPVQEEISIIKSLRFYDRPVYLLLPEDSDAPFITAADLGKATHFKLLSWHYMNNRRKQRIALYRLNPTVPEQVKETAPREPVSGNLLPNGDFEQYRLGTIPTFRDRGLPFFAAADVKLPESWSMFTPGFSADSAAEVEVTDHAISGQSSLRMASRKMISCYSAIQPKGNYQLSFLVRPEKNSKFHLMMHHYETLGNGLKWKTHTILYQFELAARTGVFRYKIPIPARDCAPGTHFSLGFGLTEGEIILDEVTLKR